MDNNNERTSLIPRYVLLNEISSWENLELRQRDYWFIRYIRSLRNNNIYICTCIYIPRSINKNTYTRGEQPTRALVNQTSRRKLAISIGPIISRIFSRPRVRPTLHAPATSTIPIIYNANLQGSSPRLCRIANYPAQKSLEVRSRCSENRPDPRKLGFEFYWARDVGRFWPTSARFLARGKERRGERERRLIAPARR